MAAPIKLRSDLDGDALQLCCLLSGSVRYSRRSLSSADGSGIRLPTPKGLSIGSG